MSHPMGTTSMAHKPQQEQGSSQGGPRGWLHYLLGVRQKSHRQGKDHVFKENEHSQTRCSRGYRKQRRTTFGTDGSPARKLVTFDCCESTDFVMPGVPHSLCYPLPAIWAKSTMKVCYCTEQPMQSRLVLTDIIPSNCYCIVDTQRCFEAFGLHLRGVLKTRSRTIVFRCAASICAFSQRANL